MLSAAGITDPNTQLEINVILSAWQLVVAFCGSLSAERLGRRVLALVSLGGATVFFFMIGGLTAKYGTSTSKSGIYGTIASIFLYLAFYSFGMTPLTVMYGPEVLSYSIRGTGMSLFTSAAKCCGLLIVRLIPIPHAERITKLDETKNTY
jgi:hypothetical protein